MVNIIPDEIREYLSYNENTGVFTWIKPTGNKVRKGKIAGGRNKTTGYVWIRFKGTIYSAHRLAWFFQTGKNPSAFVDHKNGVRDDNRWENLREATNSQNKMNGRSHRDALSKYVGVSFEKRCGKWRACICFNKKRLSLGLFEKEKDAAKAYDDAALKYHGEFARTNFTGGIHRKA